MDALLASLPGPADGALCEMSRGEGSVVGSDDAHSLLSSGGLDDCASDNGGSHLLKGGDSLYALRRGPSSQGTSATSKKSRASTSVSRQSIASRGRPLKPHEADPFLSVVSTSPRVPHSNVSSSQVPVISIQDSDLLNGNEASTPQHTLTTENVALVTDHNPMTGRPYSDVSGDNSPVRSGICPKPPSNTPTENILVKQPFKQGSAKGARSRNCPPQPGQLLRERTTSATSRVKDHLTMQAETYTKKPVGKLVKGRLKPMCPVKTTGPTIDHCKGIVSDKQRYVPSPSRSRRRRDLEFESILREYTSREINTPESIHHTSLASSEVDDRSELNSTFDAIAEVGLVNSSASNDVPGDENFSVAERPKTAASMCKSSLKVNERRLKCRPHSASVLDSGFYVTKGAKNVRFMDSSKAVQSKSSCEIGSHRDEDKSATQWHVNNENENLLKDPGGELEAKKSKMSKHTCKSSNFFLNGESNDDSDDDGDDERKTENEKFARKENNTVGIRAHISTENSPNFVSNSSKIDNSKQNGSENIESEYDSDCLCDSEDTTSNSDGCHKQKTDCFRVSTKSGSDQSTIQPNEDYVLQKTHVFNFVASQSKSCKGHGIHASHISAEYNMSPRDRVSSPLVNCSSNIEPLTFESLEAEIATVQNNIRHFLENNAEMDELETHREHDLNDLVVDSNPCRAVALRTSTGQVSDGETDESSDSEDEEVAVIALDSDDDEIAENLFTRAQYSGTLLSGELSRKQISSEDISTEKKKSKYLPSCWTGNHFYPSNGGKLKGSEVSKLNSDYLSAMETRSDSGCGSEVMSASLGDGDSRHGDFQLDDSEERKQLTHARNTDREADDFPTESDQDISRLKVVATTKDLLKLRKEKGSPSLSARYPPLCFRINARPPPGKIYYFSYGTDMNPDRLSTYIQRRVDHRLWGVLYGFKICFNKRGVDVEAGGFPNIELERDSSVEGCVYLLSQEELDRLDRCVGYPQHYERVMFPVWMSNCRDPDNYSVAQYCIPAVMYIAQDQWVHTGTRMKSGYAIGQCLKAADLLTPAYREFLYSQSVSS